MDREMRGWIKRGEGERKKGWNRVKHFFLFSFNDLRSWIQHCVYLPTEFQALVQSLFLSDLHLLLLLDSRKSQFHPFNLGLNLVVLVIIPESGTRNARKSDDHKGFNQTCWATLFQRKYPKYCIASKNQKFTDHPVSSKLCLCIYTLLTANTNIMTHRFI